MLPSIALDINYLVLNMEVIVMYHNPLKEKMRKRGVTEMTRHMDCGTRSNAVPARSRLLSSTKTIAVTACSVCMGTSKACVGGTI